MPDSPPGAITSDEQRPIDLVLEGGGVKGIGLVGALDVLARRKFVVQRIAGTSAGAIVASLLAAGYEPAAMREILMELELTRFMDEGPEDRVPLIRRPLSLITQKGIYEGDELLRWMKEKLSANGIETFGDLIYEDTADPRRRHRLQMIASDVTDREMLILPRHAEKFGTKPDDLPVAEAVRMSMGIPIFFEPWRWGDNLIVDGGLLSNFPVSLFDAPPGERLWHTFGLLLAEDKPEESIAERLEPPDPDHDGPNIIEFGKSLLQTMLEAHDRMYVSNASFLRTIMIPTLGVRTTEFTLSAARKAELYESGQAAATSFLADWRPEVFEAIHDAGDAAPGRRELVQQALPDQDG
jgi:NTE family protein